MYIIYILCILCTSTKYLKKYSVLYVELLITTYHIYVVTLTTKHSLCLQVKIIFTTI